MRFEFFIAARYLRAKRRQAVVGVITAISVIGVAAGVASLIIALAITNGMRRDLQERLVGSTSHVDLMRIAGDGIRDWRPLLERLRKVPHVVAAAPGLYGQVLISHGARSGGGLIKGVIPRDEKTVGDLLQSVKQGSAAELAPFDSTSGSAAMHAVPPIVIGQDMAETIGVKIGDGVLVTSPQGELTPLGLVPRYQRFRVAGIFKSGFYQYDSSYAFTAIADAQKLFSEPDLISVISFKVDDLYHADRVGRVIEAEAGTGLSDDELDGAESRTVSRAEAGADGDVYCAGADCMCGRAEYSDRADDDGDGEDAGHCRADELWREGGAGAEDFSAAGIADQRDWDGAGADPGVWVELGRRALPFIQLDAAVYSIDYLPFAPRVWDACDCGGGFVRGEFDCYALSEWIGGEGAACGGVKV